MDTAIFDPPIPYIGPIHGTKFSVGKLVKIQGLAPSIGYRFNINLQCGPEITPRDDVAIQISVRFLDGYISLNSLQHGIWGDEQRSALPVKRNEKFEILVLCDFNQYKIAINGQHHCEFPERINHDRITHLAIDGDVSIFRISYESVSGYNAGSGGGASAPIPTPPADNEIDDFEMIDETTNRPCQTGMRSPPPGVGLSQPPRDVGFSQPPSYEAANQVPYPTSGPTGMPYPKQGAQTPYPPMQSSGMPYPAQGTAMPYPSGAPMNSHPYSPTGGQTGFPPPLNSPYSPYRPVKRNTVKTCILPFFAVLIGAIFIICVVVAKVSISNSRHHSTYNYKSSYEDSNYGSNNYGGYNSNNNNW